MRIHHLDLRAWAGTIVVVKRNVGHVAFDYGSGLLEDRAHRLKRTRRDLWPRFFGRRRFNADHLHRAVPQRACSRQQTLVLQVVRTDGNG